MKPISNNLDDYLAVTPIIDWNTSIVANKAKELTANLQDDITKAQYLFEWVRDNIPHSKDIDADAVTCSASEVLEVGTGICFAKSHLLAAMLRAVGIPAGFCYQVCVSDDSKILHGLNGIYLLSLKRWIRVDPRGNTGEIDAQFDLQTERLAFPPNPALGEFVYNEIWSNPVPEVVEVLTKFTSRRQMWKHLPTSIS
ncbi:transglutaminase-like domain-containing protein [Aliterella atlantica]|uniref:Transglutaminase n=1 Tax=Aliterella atlantica CENA595 TaxID=1618023 RepID=A0A0D8ZMP4_9CYAN|nr:transglutaminase family protein [Aliterella atlantica]KJH70113.1 transglutaminase [Aliterella atlantica CENA595]